MLITNNIITFVSAKVTFFKYILFMEMMADSVTSLRTFV